ncbi:unnamed protein product, partial [Menidia menidia]
NGTAARPVVVVVATRSSFDIARLKSPTIGRLRGGAAEVRAAVSPGTKGRPSSTSKAESSKRVEFRPQAKSASGLTKKITSDIFAKEEHYK